MKVFDSSAIYKAISLGKPAQLFDQYTSSLAFFELGNIIWKNSQLAKIYSQKEAAEFLNICEIVLEKMRISYANLSDIYHLAAKYHVSFYDASYISLAINLNCSFVTLDEKLAHKVRSDVNVVPVEDMA